MYQKIVHDDFSMENTVVTNARHLESLQKARTTLNEVLQSLNNNESGDLTALSIRYALNAIGEITGQVTNEDLLDNIFRNFCIGK
jgi:tRNA modification GTPase